MPDLPLTIFTSSPSVYRTVRLNRFIPKNIRRFTFRVFLVICLASLVAIGVSFLLSMVAGSAFQGFFQAVDMTMIWATAFVSGAVTFFFLFFEFFYLSSVADSLVGKRGASDIYLSFDGARICRLLGIFKKKNASFSLHDAYWSLLQEPPFLLFLLRLGVREEAFRVFLSEKESLHRGAHISSREFLSLMMKGHHEAPSIILGLFDIVRALFVHDKEFVSFLFAHDIGKEDVEGVLEWISRDSREYGKTKLFWKKEYLGRAPGIAKDFGFGYTFLLDQYSYDIQGREDALVLQSRKKKISLIENILSKTGEANVLLVGKEGTGRHILLRGLASQVQKGLVPPAIEHKRLVYLDIDSIVAFAKTKGAFEEAVLRMMDEAVRAGNVILVLDNFPHIIASAHALGSDFVALTEGHVSGSHLQVIALSDPYAYHKALEPNGKIHTLFTKLEITEPDEKEMTEILEGVIGVLERKDKAFFTYQAIRRVIEIADRYIQIGAMPEKAINLADEIASRASLEGVHVITVAEVNIRASEKLKIPLGKVKEKEKETLLHLEDLLHLRVINQEEAIRTVANTMRRARTDVRSKERPLGSFLFLGPTGVGKTQTARALAEVYFGKKDAMARFDMSEFKGGEGAAKLTGAFDSPEPGMLVRNVRDNPFALFLFDELEKASKEVQNLFLQILEEGFFSDGRGERISMRETIIIATSNAGSGLIWDMVERGKDPSLHKKEIIDAVQEDGIFAPEFLNRFDGIVVFHPLSKKHLEEIAHLLLKELQDRLKEKDITFEISEDLIRKVADMGYDPQFGARPMRRAIADRIESVIAKKMLAEELKRGDTMRFSGEEIKKL